MFPWAVGPEHWVFKHEVAPRERERRERETSAQPSHLLNSTLLTKITILIEKNELAWEEMFYQMGNQFDLLEYCWNTNSCSVAVVQTSLWNFADSSSQEWISDGCTCLIAVFKCCIVTSEASRHSWLEKNYQSINNFKRQSHLIMKWTQETSIAATAASRQINDISAPVKPSVRLASSIMLMSELHEILRKWMRNISSRSVLFGGPTYSSRSKRPVQISYQLLGTLPSFWEREW